MLVRGWGKFYARVGGWVGACVGECLSVFLSICLSACPSLCLCVMFHISSFLLLRQFINLPFDHGLQFYF